MSARASMLPWPDIRARWLAHEDMGATRGCGVELAVPAGAEIGVHRHLRCERVIWVMDGVGTHHGTGGPLALEAGDVLVLSPGQWHGFRNDGDEPARLWAMYAPAARFPADDYETPGAGTQFDGDVVRHRLAGLRPDPALTVPGNGFHDLSVVWDGARGASSITFGVARFGAEGLHEWHRHPDGDEIIYVASGTSHHVTDAGDLALEGPAYAFCAANEWHSMPSDTAVECYFAYLGGSSLEAVGYERRGTATFAEDAGQ